MAGHIDFGNDGDVPVGSILHNFTHLVLCIESAVPHIFVQSRVASDDRPVSPCSHLSEQRILVDLHTPSLVFSKMPVEGVHVVQHHHIDILFDEIDIEEMTAHIEVHATVGETGAVGYLYIRNRHLLGSHGKRLAQCLYAVEHPTRGFPLNKDAFLANGETIFLVANQLLVDAQLNSIGRFLRLFLHHERQGQSFEIRLEILSEEARIAFHILIVVAANSGYIFECQSVITHHARLRKRHDIEIGILLSMAANCEKSHERKN